MPYPNKDFHSTPDDNCAACQDHRKALLKELGFVTRPLKEKEVDGIIGDMQYHRWREI